MPSDQQAFVPRDAVAETMAFVEPYLPAGTLVAQDIPDDLDWSGVELVVQISDAGGPGLRDHILDDVALTFEVGHPDSVTASYWARRVYALIRAWQIGAVGVYWGRTIQRPAYQWDSATGRPFYSFSVLMTFKAEPTTITPTA